MHARLLTYLDEVVRQGSVRKAAERLNVSPTAISRQIIGLEEQLGVPLFTRNERRLKPTAAGELLVRHVRETLKQMTQTEAAIKELQGLHRGSVSIGLMSGLAANIVPRTIVEFREKHPRIEVKVRLLTPGEFILDAVEKGDVDLGLGFDFPRRSGIRTIYESYGQLGAVMNSKHPLSGERLLRLADCTAYPLIIADNTTAIRPYIDQAFQRLNMALIAAVQTNSIEIMRHLAMVGDGITFLTPFDIESERRDGKLVHLPVHELSRHTQRLTLVESEKRSLPVAGLFAEALKIKIAESL